MKHVQVDTHSQVKRLVKRGMKEELAEEIVSVNFEMLTEQMLTKDYLDYRLSDLEKHTDKKFAEVQSQIKDVKESILKTQNTILFWIITSLLTIITSIIGLAVKLFFF